jgi:cobaltochelatase CobN
MSAVVGYVLFFAPTRVAFINFQDFQYLLFQEADRSPFYRVQRISLDKPITPRTLAKFDAVYLFGMGLHLSTQQQSAFMEAAQHGTALHVYGATAPSTINTLPPSHQDVVNQYLGYGGTLNATRLLAFTRRIVHGKILGTKALQRPYRIPSESYFHLGEQDFYESLDAYETFYTASPYFTPQAPRVVLLCSNIGPHSPSTSAPIRALIGALQHQGLNVYPMTGFFNRLDRIREVNPDAILFIAHGRVAPGQPQETIEQLKQLNVPLLCPVILFEPYEQWKNNQKGMAGGMFGQNIVVPEIDGGTAPILIGAQFADKNGLMSFKEVPGRVDKFSTLVKKTIALCSTSNANKKVAIVYYKGPGRNALTATGLEVTASLYNLLTHLKAQGYTTGPLPLDAKALFDTIQVRGLIPSHYARGVTQQFLESGTPQRIYADTLQQWMHRSLPPQLITALEKKYGPNPGAFLSAQDSAEHAFVAIPRIEFGNIVILPQLLPGEGEASDAMIRGAAASPPPYPYVASYLWLREGFKADALIHFGTYGSFEFLPFKQPPLDDTDWPDALLGPLPHLYVYCVESVGDALIAKRRSYATIISHLTPPFKPAGSYGDLHTLKSKLEQFFSCDMTPLREGYRAEISELVSSLGLDADLGMVPLAVRTPSDSILRIIEHHISVIAEEKINDGHYVLGKAYTPQQRHQTCREINVDILAGHMARLDNLKVGSPTNSSRSPKGPYRQQAYTLIDNITAGRTQPQDYIPVAQRAEVARLKALSQPNSSQQEQIAAFEEYVQTLEQLQSCEQRLENSTLHELESIVNGLAGGYIEPSTGGDPIMNPDVIPTGRNLYGVNPEQTPDAAAWRIGQELANQLILARIQQTGHYPRKVALTLWGGEFIRDRGTTIAQALALLGVEPVINRMGMVHDIKLIPCERLKRPRIDVVVQTSGQFRDLAASRLSLLEKAIKLAAEAPEPACSNYVHQQSLAMEAGLKQQGYAPREARELSTARIFGGVNGRYGAGIRELVQGGDKWEQREEIAQRYLNNMGALYSNGHWGEYKKDVFATALNNTEVIAQSVNSHITGPLALDNVYEFMGGLSAVVEMLNGTPPQGVFNDLRNRFEPRVRDAREMIRTEARASILNPHYIRSMLESGGSSLESAAESFRNCFGWSALTQDIVDPKIWNLLHETYIEDIHKLNIRQGFEHTNPYAFQEITAVMLEGARKGFWTPTPNQHRALAGLHAQLVTTHRAGCSMHVCNNAALRADIAKLLDSKQSASYSAALEQTLRVADNAAKTTTLLTEVKKPPLRQLIEHNRTALLSIGILISIVVAAVIVGGLRQRG